MRPPRVRFTVRRLMAWTIVVALALSLAIYCCDVLRNIDKPPPGLKYKSVSKTLSESKLPVK